MQENAGLKRDLDLLSQEIQDVHAAEFAYMNKKTKRVQVLYSFLPLKRRDDDIRKNSLILYMNPQSIDDA